MESGKLGQYAKKKMYFTKYGTAQTPDVICLVALKRNRELERRSRISTVNN